MNRTIATALSSIALLVGCGYEPTPSSSKSFTTPNSTRAVESCRAMRATQLSERCETVISHMPICDKTCVKFSSTSGKRVAWQCLATGPVPDSEKCNARNTWNPGLYN